MVNYNNGKIYKIESHLHEEVYIGSTTKQYLSQRMTAHRNKYYRWKENKYHMITSFLLFDRCGVENCHIVLLELCPCISKDELQAREAHHIRTTKCVNKCIPGRTPKEYRIDNTDKIKEQRQKYKTEKKVEKQLFYEANKEQIEERKQKCFELKKQFRREKSKQYRETHIDKIKSDQKLYREANQGELNRKKRERRAANKLKEQSQQQSVQ